MGIMTRAIPAPVRPEHAALVPGMTRRLTSAYRDTVDVYGPMGRGWYPAAFNSCAALAVCPADIHIVCGIAAQLSPRAQWSVNLRWTAEVYSAALNRDPMPRVSTTQRRVRAWRIAAYAAGPDVDAIPAALAFDPMSVIGTQPKVGPFYRAIMGDGDAVTLDVWAVRAATGITDERHNARLLDSVSGRPAIDVAYRRAADITGESARDLQAITWLAVRGIKPTDRAWHSAIVASN